MKKEERTSIQVSMATKDRLDKIGLKKDTYNDILIRLLDQAKRKRRQGSWQNASMTTLK